ncbi:MAG: hypothetical protein HYY80_00625 [Chloroflexi bacterium]|nr:hypothetical protein [Chloroflexota bacterium]
MMKRSRKFDNVLDECLERLLVKGETIEQCLRRFPGHSDALKPLLETALAIKKTSAIQPRAEFKDKARYQFYSALQDKAPEKSRWLFGWRPLWTTMVAIILVFLLAGGGTVMAAGGSMPDEPLYPVKLATEQARLVLTPSALGKAELYARLADRRVLEIIRMAGEGKPEQIERTARRLDNYLTRIADLASTQQVAGGESEALLAEETPKREPAPAVERAPLLPERAEKGKKARIGVGHRARLKATVEHYATNHPASLRALLEEVPPSARPALRRAIAVSETGYEKALQSLD